MNKSELVDHIAESTGQTKDSIAKTLDAALTAITTALARGDEVVLTGFGSFSVTDRAARQGRNPQTGAPIEIAASRAPAFKAGKKLKDAVNGAG